MANFGLTRSEYESFMSTLIAGEVDETVRWQKEAANCDAQAEAHGSFIKTTGCCAPNAGAAGPSVPGRGMVAMLRRAYHKKFTDPSKPCLEIAAIWRERAKLCRAQAQVHFSQAQEYEAHRAIVLSSDYFLKTC